MCSTQYIYIYICKYTYIKNEHTNQQTEQQQLTTKQIKHYVQNDIYMYINGTHTNNQKTN